MMWKCISHLSPQTSSSRLQVVFKSCLEAFLKRPWSLNWLNISESPSSWQFAIPLADVSFLNYQPNRRPLSKKYKFNFFINFKNFKNQKSGGRSLWQQNYKAGIRKSVCFKITRSKYDDSVNLEFSLKFYWTRIYLNFIKNQDKIAWNFGKFFTFVKKSGFCGNRHATYPMDRRSSWPQRLSFWNSKC